ncbi:MAG TPA: LamG domain-containing protein [Cyclobacteriaceae bacterium]|nr:LamG domain-containing protein [Cyclobacteriaceae bacterium]HMV11023.1 LamG domain-containing protein [Cyclobacteriaceae bacterium]HMV88622.1 LamG domain-containing protein [Cyclobacteriaceae bacterium]HMX00616.1 LamG domain-containing protein [Cyclobacteriaceae bacterium]HMX49509.1 LamG domain-containing protein [Cyclobacteriaceae bacterium]
MKRICLSSFIILVTIFSCSENDNKDNDLQAPSDGLVAYYNFNGNSLDREGSNDGTDTNVTYTFRDDENKEAAHFAGDNSFVDLPDDFDFEDKTIALSFSAESISPTRSVLYGSDHNNLEFGLTVMTLIDNGGNKTLDLNVSNEVVSIPVSENTWYNVIMISDSKTYRYYVNGTLVGSGTFANYIHSGNGDAFATIGRARVPVLFYDGLVDNVRIYNRALTEEEVEILADF